MRKLEEIVKEVAEIYRKNEKEAEEYLHKARKLKERYGSGLAIVYCGFIRFHRNGLKWSIRFLS